MNSHQSCRVGLIFEPLDQLFFRDGRPFEAGSHARSVSPMPQTVAGALRTWLLQEAGCDFGKLKADLESMSFTEACRNQPGLTPLVGELQFRGPWFARLRADGSAEPYVSVPASLRQPKEGELTDGCPQVLPWRGNDPIRDWLPPEEGMVPVWLADTRPTEPVEADYLTFEGLCAFLSGQPVKKDHLVRSEELFQHAERTGINIYQRTQSVPEDAIYSIAMLELAKNTCIYAEAIGPPELLPTEPTPIRLGGEGRRVLMRRVDPVQWPSAKPSNGQGRLLLLTSPGIFYSWRPQCLAGKLLAAVVAGYLPVSGWDLAQGGPKPTRFAVRPGAVYFLKEKAEFSSPTGSLCEGDDTALGWGTFLEGVWNNVKHG